MLRLPQSLKEVSKPSVLRFLGRSKYSRKSPVTHFDKREATKLLDSVDIYVINAHGYIRPTAFLLCNCNGRVGIYLRSTGMYGVICFHSTIQHLHHSQTLRV